MKRWCESTADYATRLERRINELESRVNGLNNHQQPTYWQQVQMMQMMQPQPTNWQQVQLAQIAQIGYYNY